MKAVIYARYSSDSQREESIEGQLRECTALARYEIDDSTPSPEVFLKYADYFDVSLDYIFGRTDDPHGMIYNNCVKLGLNNPEMARFVEMCVDPGSAMNERLKATLVQMLSEVDTK